MVDTAQIITIAIAAYLGVGVIFGLVFVARRVAPVEGRAILLRLMLLPGAALLWPALITRGSRR